jgi:hypothetical protein
MHHQTTSKLSKVFSTSCILPSCDQLQLFDDLISAQHDRRGYRKAERLGSTLSDWAAVSKEGI